MSVIVRQISDADRGPWNQLFAEYLDFYESSLPDSLIDQTWNSLVATPARIGGVVAVVDDVVAGFAHFHVQVSTWQTGGACYLEDLFVSPHCRSRGVATALIHAVRDEARSRGCGEMYWITRSSNLTAQRLYDRLAVKTDFLRYEIRDL